MSKPLIAISGSPGTGKSTLAKILVKKLGLERLDLHHHYKQISTGYDRSKQSYDIDYHKFERLVKEKLKQTKKGLVIDSHISHLLPKKLVHLCIVLTCSDLKTLEMRLKKRKYSKQKIRENLDAEIFQICLTEATEKKHKILIFDTAKEKTAKIISAITAALCNHN
ncbi:MAG: adenylate kinase family protein [Nanoarchaeota archaeon]